MFRTANPAFNNDAFAPSDWEGLKSDRTTGRIASPAKLMTLQGTVIKTGFLLVLTMAAAAGTYVGMERQAIPSASPMIGMVVGLVVGLIICFAPKAAPFLAPLYALAEGVLLGGISLFAAAKAGPQGAALISQAVALTFGIFAALLVTFSMGLVRMGSTMTKVVVVGTMGVAFLYLASLLLQVFGLGNIPFIHSSGPLGIAFSLVVVVLASLNLVLDFQRVEAGIQNAAPKYMEWYSGYALLVTLVWLYIEILRLLSKLGSNRN
jgi:uncharacterized YccA/Bax inhibitor family protein